MERKIKYQYSYFIHPYIIDEKKYDKYISKLLNDKHCKLKLFEKQKDLNLYTYFSPKIRDYLFWSLSYTNEQIKELEKTDNYLKASIISKYPSVMFEYNLGKDIQGKIGEKDGIFFDIEKINIICFKTGVCFILIKTLVEDNKMSNILNFNYKFRDINLDLDVLKDYENIRIQTDSLKDIKDISTIIKRIIGNNEKNDKQIKIEESFLCYSYVCLEQEEWNSQNEFSNIEEDFIKAINILPSSDKSNYNKEIYEENILEIFKYSKMGITKKGITLLTSEIEPENYTRLVYRYEQEYLYTYILALYKRIYLEKLNLELKTKKNIRKIKYKLLEFTETFWIQTITNNIEGSKIYQKIEEILKLNDLYYEIKGKYEAIYKNINIEKTKKINYIIIPILIGILIFNIINFILILFR